MQKSVKPVDTSRQLGYYDTFGPRGIRAVDPDSVNPDPDPAFQLNTDPGF
jgi:hypothetical protein